MPLVTRITLDVFFFVIKILFRLRNALLVGKSDISNIYSTVSVSSFTVAPYGGKGDLVYAPYANWEKLKVIIDQIRNIRIPNKKMAFNLNQKMPRFGYSTFK